MSKKPFTLPAYYEEIVRDPDFDLFETFTFDPLGDDEVAGIIALFREAAADYVREAKLIGRYLADRKRGRL